LPTTPVFRSARQGIRLVARRELRVRLRSRSYAIFTLLMLVGIVGFSIAVKIIGAVRERGRLLPEAAAMVDPVKGAAAAIGEKVTAVAVPNRAEGERQLRDGTIDVLLVGPPTRCTWWCARSSAKRVPGVDRARPAAGAQQADHGRG